MFHKSRCSIPEDAWVNERELGKIVEYKTFKDDIARMLLARIAKIEMNRPLFIEIHKYFGGDNDF